jgi:hypothetical protein
MQENQTILGVDCKRSNCRTAPDVDANFNAVGASDD